MKKLNLTDNLFLKGLSVVVAVILWLAVVNINDAEITKDFSVPVTLLNTELITENGKVYRVEEGTDRVKLTVRERKSIVDDLKNTDFTVTADMKKDLKFNSLVGINVQCKNRYINVNEDITLDRHNVEVSIEDSATEQFPIIVRHIGTPADGLVVGSLVPEQTVIKITGPVSIVERIKLVEALVDVTGLPGNTVKTCSLNLYDGADGLLDTTYLNYVGKSDGIDVTVSLLNTKTVPIRVSYTGTPAENYEVTEISCKPEMIDIAGTSDVLKGISRLEIPEEAVNVDGIDEELQMVIDIKEYLPSGIILEKDEEASVLITVEVAYVEPEVEEEDPSWGNSGNTEPSQGTTDKNEDTSVEDKPADKEDTDTGNENDSAAGTEGSENGSSGQKPETDTTDKQENQNNQGTESGANVKPESDS